MLDIDSIFGKERNRTLDLMNTGKIFKQGFNKINSMDEIYYGSSTGESTYTQTKDMIDILSYNYSKTFSELRKLDEGTYIKIGLRTQSEVHDA